MCPQKPVTCRYPERDLVHTTLHLNGIQMWLQEAATNPLQFFWAYSRLWCGIFAEVVVYLLYEDVMLVYECNK
jgi:hypothetical protein